MSTLSELIAHRDTAGARYVAAVQELRDSFGDLAAIERLLTNGNAGKMTLATFAGPRPDPIPLRHPTYLPALGGSFEDDIRAAYTTRETEFGTPDE